jgi:hypothetical protein
MLGRPAKQHDYPTDVCPVRRRILMPEGKRHAKRQGSAGASGHLSMNIEAAVNGTSAELTLARERNWRRVENLVD